MEEIRSHVKILFVGGPPRSGTTALVHYLNRHPQMLICMERYKWVQPHLITPELFTFDRILDYRTGQRGRRGETNTPRKHHVELLARKNPENLEWIGDKTPAYVEKLRWLSENNPGASFILTYRPLEEVVESFEARFKDPGDAWSLGGFEEGVELWNAAMRSARNFLDSARNLNVLIVSYHDFFYDNEALIPQLASFLDIEIDRELRAAWAAMSRSFETRRRPKEPLSDGMRAYLAANKAGAAERAVLEHIGRQREELELYGPDALRLLAEERRRSAVRVAEESARARRLKRELEKLR